jgi:ectoine hydroxylase-related dioxygenase (phytanoyl-CoA dioxygenase family)
MAIDGPLSRAQLEEYDQRGFLIVTNVFSADEVRQMSSAFERLSIRARQVQTTSLVDGSQFVVTDDVIHRVVWCGACEPILLQLGADPRLVSMAAQLLECTRMHQLINQAHFKLPGDGVAFEWHQDSRHRRYGTPLWNDVGVRGSFVETATAIDFMTESNGPLQFIPGSHRGGHIDVDPVTGELPPEVFDLASCETITLAPGSVALFGPYTIHASGPNESSSPRRLFLNGFAHPDANRRVYPGEGAGREVSLTTPVA